MLRVWNLSLSCATFCLTILGTFLTRSGVLDSVHAFSAVEHRRRRSSRSSRWSSPSASGSSPGGAIGCARRGASTRRSRGRARSWPTTCCSPPSRSWCCSAPSSRCSSRRCSNEQISVGRAVLRPHDRADRAGAAVPDGRRARAAVAHGVGAGAAPPPAVAGLDRGADPRRLRRLRRPGRRPARRLRPRRLRRGRHRPPVRPRRRRHPPGGIRPGFPRRVARRPAPDGGRNRRLYGGLVVHFGVVVLAVALAASMGYTTKKEFYLAQGERVTLRGHHFTYLGTTRHQTGQKDKIQARIRVERGGHDLGVYAPALSIFPRLAPGDRHAVRPHRSPAGRLPDPGVLPRSGRAHHPRRPDRPAGRLALDRRRDPVLRDGHRRLARPPPPPRGSDRPRSPRPARPARPLRRRGTPGRGPRTTTPAAGAPRVLGTDRPAKPGRSVPRSGGPAVVRGGR